MTSNEQWNGQFRHLLTTASGILIMKGIVSAEEAELYSQLAWILPGVLIGAIALVKSWRSKNANAKTIDLVEQIAEKVIARIEEKKQQI